MSDVPVWDWKYIDRWYNTISYKFAPGWRAFAAYQYSDYYVYRAALFHGVHADGD